MSRKQQLRKQRAGTVINVTSKKMENRVIKALKVVENTLQEEFGLELHHTTDWKLPSIVDRLQRAFPDVDFHCYHKNSSMRPDGGILSIVAKEDIERYPILITEVKNQGTNDLRHREGKKRQAKGNAIERLGKNVIGFRAALRNEGIFPFVCFGDGCDFEDDSSILDRVCTIAMFGKLKTVNVVNAGPDGLFNRGTFFFRAPQWTTEEMGEVMREVARRSIHYYFAKYGEEYFKTAK